MFSLTLRFISYTFSALIALAGILFLIAMGYMITNSYAVQEIAETLGIPIRPWMAALVPWILSVAGILLLGPITLICANFFQQGKIIELLEAQNNELMHARLDRNSKGD